MKKLILITAIIATSILTVKAQYHIKPVVWPKTSKWSLVFSNDAWNSFDDILIAKKDKTGLEPALFISEEEAQRFSKRFKSYKSCLNFNRTSEWAIRKTKKDSISSDQNVSLVAVK